MQQVVSLDSSWPNREAQSTPLRYHTPRRSSPFRFPEHTHICDMDGNARPVYGSTRSLGVSGWIAHTLESLGVERCAPRTIMSSNLESKIGLGSNCRPRWWKKLQGRSNRRTMETVPTEAARREREKVYRLRRDARDGACARPWRIGTMQLDRGSALLCRIVGRMCSRVLSSSVALSVTSHGACLAGPIRQWPLVHRRTK